MQTIWKCFSSDVIRNLKAWEICQNKSMLYGLPRYIHSSLPTLASSRQESASAETEDFLEPEKPKALTEEELLRMRNKSRLKPHLFALINGEQPIPDERLWYRNTVKFRRRLYAKFGEASGVNPGIQWPTHAELKKRLEYESVAYPFTLQEMIANVKEKRRLEQEYIDKRTKEIETNVALIDKVIKEVHDKKAQKEKEVLKAQEKKAKMVEEVRRHFGYTMDPRDERFQALLEKKEKEEKKRSKEAKKLEKEKQMLERLQQKSALVGQEKSKPKQAKDAGASDDA